jgi:ABC-type multidrug transport system ATPase subunit
MPTVIDVQQIFKNFGSIRALDNVTVQLEQGERAVLLGPNGAGKSTLLKIISAQMVPSSGVVKVLEHDTLKEREMVKKSVGVVGHQSYMYAELTVDENLRFYGQFFNAKPEEINQVIETTGLGRWQHVKTGHLSFGLRKRSDIARALLGNPEILLFDEFFSGLDKKTADSLIEHFRGLEEKTILVSSHSVERVRLFCERGIFLRHGVLEKDEAL